MTKKAVLPASCTEHTSDSNCVFPVVLVRVFSPRCSDSYAIVIVATCELHSAYPVFNLCLPNCFGVSAISKLSCLMFGYVSNLSLKFEINSKRSIIVPWQPLEPMPLPRPQQVPPLCLPSCALGSSWRML